VWWSKATPETDKPLSAEDIVLSILYAERGKPIRGKLVFMKTVFLSIKQVFREYEREFRFIPYDYGPYSQTFARILNELLERGLVESSVADIGEGKIRYDYCLTSSGRTKAGLSYGKLSLDQKSTLENLKMQLAELGYRDFLRYVYARYPEYAVSSKIRAEING
jgi:uncharacterized protein YwgA